MDDERNRTEVQNRITFANCIVHILIEFPGVFSDSYDFTNNHSLWFIPVQHFKSNGEYSGHLVEMGHGDMDDSCFRAYGMLHWIEKGMSLRIPL
jgi:hypothetical protein